VRHIVFHVPDPVHRLSALTTAVDDRIRTAVEESSGFAGLAPDAILTIGHAPGLRVEDVATMLRISHSGAVRTVDRLVDAGLVERRPSAADRRTVEVWLTAPGRRRRDEVIAARNRAIADALAPLDPPEREALGALVDRLLVGLASQPGADYSICRLCDPADCPAACPVEQGISGRAG
jgi:MarR family transcriptional regulator, negative regulator of the multidrug operon emrRAB